MSINWNKIRENNIKKAQKGEIPDNCEYGTCVLCEKDTIVDKDGICEVCFYQNR